MSLYLPRPTLEAAILGAFEQLILFSVLELEDTAYGVSVREHIEDRTGRTISIGAIYTTLGRLEDRGLVRSRSEKPSGRPGRPRKYYALTAAGARDLRDSYASIQSIAGGLMARLESLTAD